MAKIEDEEKDIEIPTEEDENVGEGAPIKKKEKRRKSKEEKIAERKVIFWTMVVILVITLAFWLVPKVGGIFSGRSTVSTSSKSPETKTTAPKTDHKNYVEITL